MSLGLIAPCTLFEHSLLSTPVSSRTMADAASAESYWISDSSLPDDHRSTENLPTETDILVVGGGYAAACFVTHLLAKAKGSVPSTLVLEARGLCSGATGRNGSHRP
jgi:hypothetical protein